MRLVCHSRAVTKMMSSVERGTAGWYELEFSFPWLFCLSHAHHRSSVCSTSHKCHWRYTYYIHLVLCICTHYMLHSMHLSTYIHACTHTHTCSGSPLLDMGHMAFHKRKGQRTALTDCHNTSANVVCWQWLWHNHTERTSCNFSSSMSSCHSSTAHWNFLWPKCKMFFCPEWFVRPQQSTRLVCVK